jgi:hypothetical protein
MHATAQSLHTPQTYIRDVMQAEPGAEARRTGPT